MKFPDGLRALAALLVLLPHSEGLFSYWQSPSRITQLVLWACPFGRCGVQIFFVLSGFVIAYTLRNQRIGLTYIGRFILRRSVRLDPPYWAAIALFCAYILLQRHASPSPPPLPSAPQVMAHLFYLQNILHYGDINIVFWTLCIEIQFYIVFCLLIWLVQRTMNGNRGVFLLVFLASLAWPIRYADVDNITAWFPLHWYAFLIGAIVWWTIDSSFPLRVGYGSVAILLAIALVRWDVRPFVVGCTAGALLYAHNTNNMYRWLRNDLMQFLGRLSYCIYLVHVPVAGVVLAIMARLRPHNEIVSYILMLAVGVISIGAAYVLHVLVEKPALGWSKQLKNWGAGVKRKPGTAFIDAEIEPVGVRGADEFLHEWRTSA
jgi:peptidoglycan/LPS O-acetylase OafA/YrhL